MAKHTTCRWVRLYIERWLKAPFQQADGVQVTRDRGTPQGGCVSAVLANLFLHYALDQWMIRTFPHLPFARYADDAVVHCHTQAEAERFLVALQERLRVYHLELNSEKTQIVCCNVKRQSANNLAKKFTFLGYEFRPRLVRSRQGRMFVAFTPALSPCAAKRMRQRIRRWRLNLQASRTLEEIAHEVNPIVRGWVTYYGAYNRSALYPILRQIDLHLVQWVKRKWTKKGCYFKRAKHGLGKTAFHRPKLFVHWQFGIRFPTG